MRVCCGKWRVTVTQKKKWKSENGSSQRKKSVRDFSSVGRNIFPPRFSSADSSRSAPAKRTALASASIRRSPPQSAPAHPNSGRRSGAPAWSSTSWRGVSSRQSRSANRAPGRRRKRRLAPSPAHRWTAPAAPAWRLMTRRASCSGPCTHPPTGAIQTDQNQVQEKKNRGWDHSRFPELCLLQNFWKKPAGDCARLEEKEE